MRNSTIIAIVVMLVMLIALPAPSVTAAEETVPQTATISVDSTNLRFSPASVTIHEGDTVQFLWVDEDLPHNAVERNGVFDSGDAAESVNYSFTFTEGMAGTYEYVCEPHELAGMVGKIVVKSNSNTEPVTTSKSTPFLPTVMVALALVGAAFLYRD